MNWLVEKFFSRIFRYYMDSKGAIKVFGYTLIILVAISLIIWSECYRYKDCKKVGHTTFYCILNMGK